MIVMGFESEVKSISFLRRFLILGGIVVPIFFCSRSDLFAGGFHNEKQGRNVQSLQFVFNDSLGRQCQLSNGSVADGLSDIDCLSAVSENPSLLNLYRGYIAKIRFHQRMLNRLAQTLSEKNKCPAILQLRYVDAFQIWKTRDGFWTASLETNEERQETRFQRMLEAGYSIPRDVRVDDVHRRIYDLLSNSHDASGFDPIDQKSIRTVASIEFSWVCNSQGGQFGGLNKNISGEFIPARYVTHEHGSVKWQKWMTSFDFRGRMAENRGFENGFRYVLKAVQ